MSGRIPKNVETLGAAIRWAREQRRTTLRGLARQLSLSPPYLSDIEHNRRVPADLDLFARVLGVKVSDLRERVGVVDRQTREFIEKHPDLMRLIRARQRDCCCGRRLVLR